MLSVSDVLSVSGSKDRAFLMRLCLMVLQVQLAEAFERFWGRFGDRHLCVSNAMKDELQKHWKIKATVFYDRPPAQFEPTPLAQKVSPVKTLFKGRSQIMEEGFDQTY